MTKLDKVFDAIAVERNYQDRKWGGTTHDQNHNLGDWISFMETYLDEARNANSHGDSTTALAKIKKVTALGVAAMEYLGTGPESR